MSVTDTTGPTGAVDVVLVDDHHLFRTGVKASLVHAVSPAKGVRASTEPGGCSRRKSR